MCLCIDVYLKETGIFDIERKSMFYIFKDIESAKMFVGFT